MVPSTYAYDHRAPRPALAPETTTPHLSAPSGSINHGAGVGSTSTSTSSAQRSHSPSDNMSEGSFTRARGSPESASSVERDEGSGARKRAKPQAGSGGAGRRKGQEISLACYNCRSRKVKVSTQYFAFCTRPCWSSRPLKGEARRVKEARWEGQGVELDSPHVSARPTMPLLPSHALLSRSVPSSNLSVAPRGKGGPVLPRLERAGPAGRPGRREVPVELPAWSCLRHPPCRTKLTLSRPGSTQCTVRLAAADVLKMRRQRR